jgi:GxxExxY protein
MNLLFEKKTSTLRRGLFDVQNEVGVGRDEEDYHQAFALWLAGNDVPFESKPSWPLMIHDQLAYTLIPDVVAWDEIVIELKALQRKLRKPEMAQLFDYLKARDKSLGLLTNLGLGRVEVQRLVFERRVSEFDEDWNQWTGEVSGEAREAGLKVRQALRDVYDQHGTGYSAEVLRRLILTALAHHGLSVVENPTAQACFRGVELRESTLDCLLINEQIVLSYTALFDEANYAMSRALSYLRVLRLSWAVAANFGKTTARIIGIGAHK